jgi:hypothetical protein
MFFIDKTLSRILDSVQTTLARVNRKSGIGNRNIAVIPAHAGIQSIKFISSGARNSSLMPAPTACNGNEDICLLDAGVRQHDGCFSIPDSRFTIHYQLLTAVPSMPPPP